MKLPDWVKNKADSSDLEALGEITTTVSNPTPEVKADIIKTVEIIKAIDDQLNKSTSS